LQGALPGIQKIVPCKRSSEASWWLVQGVRRSPSRFCTIIKSKLKNVVSLGSVFVTNDYKTVIGAVLSKYFSK